MFEVRATRASPWKTLRLVGSLGALLVLACYPLVKLRRAAADVAAFCAEVPAPGERGDLDALAERARARGLTIEPHGERGQGRLLASSGWLFAHSSCAIEIANGVVVARRIESDNPSRAEAAQPQPSQGSEVQPHREK